MSLVKDTLHELFTYKDGKLYWKISKGRVKAGDEAGTTLDNGYKQVKINNKKHLIHRVVFIMFGGHLAQRIQIDHINGIRDDNRIENLRAVSNQQNAFNTKAKGYSYHKTLDKFGAYIYLNAKKMHLGYFDTKEEARKAYLKAKKEYHKI